MPNIEHVMTSLKCSWIKLFLNNTKWTRLFKATSGLTTNKLINYGDYFIIQQKEKKILNQFLRDVLFSWVLVEQTQNVQNTEDIERINIRYNTKILKESKPFLHSHYIKKGIVFIGDLLDDEGNILNLVTFKRKYDVKPIF